MSAVEENIMGNISQIDLFSVFMPILWVYLLVIQ